MIFRLKSGKTTDFEVVSVVLKSVGFELEIRGLRRDLGVFEA